jgi:hypothetical protein
MMIIWTDPTVQAAAIQAAGSFLAALIAGICAAVIGHQITGRKRLQDNLDNAHRDIDFLLAVEAGHCDKHRDNGDESNKIRIRNLVRDKGLVWSGRNTPGRRTAEVNQ